MKTPTVEQRPINPSYLDTKVSPETFGAGLGAAVVDASTELGKIGASLQLEQDRQDVLRITSTATEMFNEKMQDYTHRMLSDAKGVTDEARVEFDKIKKWAGEATSNPRQNRLVSESLDHASVAHLGTTRAHEFDQFTLETKRVASDMINASIDAVKTDPMNEETAWVAKHNAAASVANQYSGLDEKKMTQLKAEAVSKVTASQLETLLAKGKTSDFLVLYPQVMSELTGNDADRFSKYATETVDLANVQTLTANFYAANPDNMNAAIDSARSVLTGKQEEDVVNSLKTNYATVEAGKRQVQGDDIDSAKKAFVEGGWKVSSIPRDVYSRVLEHNAEVIMSLTGMETQHAAGARAAIKTDPQTWHDWNFLTKAEKQLPENDPLRYAAIWNEGDYQKAIGIVASIKEEEGGFKKQPKGWTDHELAKLITDKFADVYKDRSGGNARRFQQFEGAVRESIKNYEALNDGNPPSYEQIEKEVAYQLVEGRRGAPGRLWDDKGRRFQLKSGEEFAPFDASAPQSDPLDEINTVPTLDAAQIASSLRAKQMPVTKEAILYWYKQSLAAKNVSRSSPTPPPPPVPPSKPSETAPIPKRTRAEP